MQTVHIAEDYSVRTLTGVALLSRLALTGWGAVTLGVTALEAFTDRGRLWWRFTASTNTLEFFRRPTLLSGDRVAFTDTAAADGKAVLVAANTSGFSGTCDITGGTPGANPTQDATGDVIISYADENELISACADVQGYLDGDSKWNAQGVRFEALLRESKRELDERIVEKLCKDLARDAGGRRLLAAIADPRQLARVHALYTVYLLDAHRAGDDPARMESSQWHLDRALGLLKATRIALDNEADGINDVEKRSADRYLSRA